MPNLRFTTVADLQDAFPTAASEMSVRPGDVPALEWLQTRIADAFASGKPGEMAALASLRANHALRDAVSFTAYLLPRRQAVWWACRSVRLLGTPLAREDDNRLRLAEDWVRLPEEELRQRALDQGLRGPRDAPVSYALLAAGRSGGQDELGRLTQPHETPQAVRAALLIGIAQASAAERATCSRACLEEGLRLLSSAGA